MWRSGYVNLVMFIIDNGKYKFFYMWRGGINISMWYLIDIVSMWEVGLIIYYKKYLNFLLGNILW